MYELRRELAILFCRLSPASDVSSILAEIKPLIRRCRPLCDAPNARDFARIDAEFFRTMCRMSENKALREVAQALFFRTSRIWVHSIPEMNLGQEIRVFLSEMEEIHAALSSGDLESVGHIRWLHISKSFFLRAEGGSLPGVSPG